MSRPSLPRTQHDAQGAAFFPTLQKEMNRLLDQFRSGFPMSDSDQASVFSRGSFPALDVIETDDAVEISAEVPGVMEDDLDVTVSGETLVLKGEKSTDHEETEDTYHLIERRYGSFRRQVPLGFVPEDGAIDARFADGVLKLRIAKPATAKAEVQKINIKKT